MTGPPTHQELEQADQALATLQFIPAVIVQGSRWLFVLSTRQGQKTVLWKEWQFGSTATVMKTSQIVAGLRQLAAWTDKVYLPWFQKEILAYYESSIKKDSKHSSYYSLLKVFRGIIVITSYI
ncbi:hypothetical protein FOXYSP1_20393 [Fusarium oxysporum f. sp. phaseoli]